MMDDRLEELIRNELNSLSNEFAIERPNLAFESLINDGEDGNFCAGAYYPGEQKIVLSECHGSLHAFYHEFCHHLQHLKDPAVFVRGFWPGKRTKETTEIEADEFADAQLNRIKCKCGNPAKYEVETVKYGLVVHDPNHPNSAEFKRPTYRTVFACSRCQKRLAKTLRNSGERGYGEVKTLGSGRWERF